MQSPLLQALLLCALAGAAVAQLQEDLTTTTTPVPILKQVNRVNDDGSYTYGFEAGDGSFKLETRLANGEVTGKYGYVDSNGVTQTFDYVANKAAGFTPSGSLIPNPPPGLPASTSDVPAGTFVGDIDVALQGYSEDLDEDGFVDPIPTELLNRQRTPAAPRQAAPRPAAPRTVVPRPAAPRPVAPAAPAAPARQAPLPASTFRFQPQQLPQQLPQQQQQFAPQQQQFARQPFPQQQFARQPFPQQQFAPQQQQFGRQPFPQQLAPQARAQLLPQQAAAAPQPPAGAQRFLVQGFNARGQPVNAFRPVQ